MSDAMTPSPNKTDHLKEMSPQALRWQCRRGMLELDILLNEFVETQYAQLNQVQRQTFSLLLSYPDQTLYELLMDKMAASDNTIADMVQRIRASISIS